MPASVEKTYSDALFSLVSEKGDKAAFINVLNELETIDEVIAGAPDFIKLFGTPTVSNDEKLSLIEKAFSGRVSEYVLNFLRVLTVKGRMGYYNRIYKTFRGSFNEKFGIAEITVTSSLPLSDALRAKITSRMTDITKKEVLLREKVDKSIIGGVMIDYGNTRLDGSVKTRLNELKKDIAGIIA
jgi:F-type H+-transporting ATPase subunit delta